MNKVSGGDGIPAELFQILKDDVVKVLHSICQQLRKTRQWPQDWKRSVFIPIPKMGNAKECSNSHTIVLISHASKVIKAHRAYMYSWMDFHMQTDQETDDSHPRTPNMCPSQSLTPPSQR